MHDRADTGVEPPQRPRKCDRVALSAEVTLRRLGQINYRVRVYDASPHGCKVEFIERPTLKEVVWVKFEGLEAIEALVCWVRGAEAGIEFRRPMYPAVFDMLLQRLNRPA